MTGKRRLVLGGIGAFTAGVLYSDFPHSVGRGFLQFVGGLGTAWIDLLGVVSVAVVAVPR